MKTLRLKAKYSFILMAAACLMMLAGCKKAPINTDIEGFWELKEFTTHADGQIHPCERIYYSIQLQIVQVDELEGTQKLKGLKGLFNYDEASNTVSMTGFYQAGSHPGAEMTPEMLRQYHAYGLGGADNTFEVLKADGKWLVLKSDYATLTLKKF